MSISIPGEILESGRRPAGHAGRGGLDVGIVIGIAVASLALVAGIAVTGVNPRYFLQPAGLLIVVGGTLGVMLITTPARVLLLVLRRTSSLLSQTISPNRNDLIDEIVSCAKIVRIDGILAIEPRIDHVSHSFLQEALQLAIDTEARAELQSALEIKIRQDERQSDAVARVLEVAGGVAPTMGVLGTVVGLIDVLRQFSSVSAIAYGVGAAFTSTIYGLALANLLLLPAAHRIRARASELFDLQELMTEGVLCVLDRTHPRLVRHRLRSFLNAVPERTRSIQTIESAPQATQI